MVFYKERHMRVKDIIDESFQDYKKPSMLISSCFCDWKCCSSDNIKMCQNSKLAQQKIIDISDENIYKRYINNNITSAIIIAGLEPLLQFDEVYSLIKYFREQGCSDDVVIYTGYNESEVVNEIYRLKTLGNIIMKFGRYIPNSEKIYDDVLGITLASVNQYAKTI